MQHTSQSIDFTFIVMINDDKFLTYVYNNYTVYQIFLLTGFDLRVKDEILTLLMHVLSNYFVYNTKYSYPTRRFPRLISHVLFDEGLQKEVNNSNIYCDLIDVIIQNEPFRIKTSIPMSTHIIYQNKILKLNLGNFSFNSPIFLDPDTKATLVEDLLFLFYAAWNGIELSWVTTKITATNYSPSQNEFIRAMSSGKYTKVDELTKDIHRVMKFMSVDYEVAYLGLVLNNYQFYETITDLTNKFREIKSKLCSVRNSNRQ